MLITVFIFLTLLGVGIFMVASQSDKGAEATRSRLALITAPVRAQALSDFPTLLSGNLAKYSLASLEARIIDSYAGKKLSTLILQSGSGSNPSKVTATSVIIASAGAFTTAILSGSLIMAALAFVIAGFVPITVLRLKRKRRIARFEAALPNAIDLMARSLRAGHSVAAAMEIISERCAEPLAGEFAKVTQEQRLGVVFRNSVLGLAGRVPSRDLQFLVTAMIVQRESGGDLTAILEGTRKVIADRLRINGQVRKHSAQGRFTGWVLSSLPFLLVVLINVLNPDYMHVLFVDPIGKTMLFVGTAFIVIGIFTMRKIVNVEV